MKMQFITTATLIFILLLSGCNMLPVKQAKVAPPPPPAQPKLISAEPILSPSKQDLMFSQAALNQLGYKLGQVDGIWGKRSKTSINAFHADNNLAFTDGKLTTWDINEFQSRTKLKYEDFAISTSLLNKLDKKIPLSKGPQLIILDKPYSMLTKANPYSEVLKTLEAGTGIYIVSHQLGWIEIESLDRRRGFIKDQ